MKKNNSLQKPGPSEEEKQAVFRLIGLAAGLISKAFLEAGGCVVDYKINGESIMDIEKLAAIDITERIKLAIAEERYEDAANLKKLLDKAKGKQSEI